MPHLGRALDGDETMDRTTLPYPDEAAEWLTRAQDRAARLEAGRRLAPVVTRPLPAYDAGPASRAVGRRVRALTAEEHEHWCLQCRRPARHRDVRCGLPTWTLVGGCRPVSAGHGRGR